jgi:hypothetical protein
MKKREIVFCAAGLIAVAGGSVWADQPATVTLAVNSVDHGSSDAATTPATKGTAIHDGEYLKTGEQSRAELLLPSASITRLGSYTIFNYSVDSNTVDLQKGTILFCKPKDANRLNIKTAAVTAGIVGTTGFISVHGEGKSATYVLGIVEGHALAHADDHPFILGPGDALQFKAGGKPFIFAYDVPRFVHSSPLLSKGKYPGTLPNQSYIDKELADYADDVSRGFIAEPSSSIDYSGGIPVLSSIAYSSAQNAQAMGKPNATPTPSSPPPPPSYPQSPTGASSYH